MNEIPVTVVVGAASGIGKAVCAELLKREDTVVVGLDRAWAGEQRTDQFIPLTADATNKESIDGAFAEIDSLSLGPLKSLVYAAGVQRQIASEDLSLEDLVAMLTLHVGGALLCCQAVSSRMRLGGSIVLFSSIAEFFGFPARAAYAIAKAGVSALSRSLSVEWASRNIRVNSIAPGYVDTPLLKAAMDRGDLSFNPLELNVMKRLASAAEIARPVCFLLSDDASYITGETLVVDGGYRVFKAW